MSILWKHFQSITTPSLLSVPVTIGLRRWGGAFTFGHACVCSHLALLLLVFAFVRAWGLLLVPVGEWGWGLPPLLLLLLSCLSSPFLLLSPHFFPLIPFLLFLPIYLL